MTQSSQWRQHRLGDNCLDVPCRVDQSPDWKWTSLETWKSTFSQTELERFYRQDWQTVSFNFTCCQSCSEKCSVSSKSVCTVAFQQAGHRFDSCWAARSPHAREGFLPQSENTREVNKLNWCFHSVVHSVVSEVWLRQLNTLWSRCALVLVFHYFVSWKWIKMWIVCSNQPELFKYYVAFRAVLTFKWS